MARRPTVSPRLRKLALNSFCLQFPRMMSEPTFLFVIAPLLARRSAVVTNRNCIVITNQSKLRKSWSFGNPRQTCGCRKALFAKIALTPFVKIFALTNQSTSHRPPVARDPRPPRSFLSPCSITLFVTRGGNWGLQGRTQECTHRNSDLDEHRVSQGFDDC